MQDANERNQSLALYVLIGNLLTKQNETAVIEKSRDSCFTIEILNLIFEFLVPKDTHLLSRAQLRLFQNRPNAPAYLLERRSYLSHTLRNIVAVEGEDNQNKARVFLQQHLDVASYLISHQGAMVDAAGRCFGDLSAYGYLYWAGDTNLLAMLDEFTDVATQNKLYLECYNIETHGLDYQQQDELFVGSSHFSMKSVIEAAYEYDVAALPLITIKNWQRKAWEPMKPLWLNLGRELGQVPLWIAQLFCSKLSFCPPPSFKGLEFERTIMFENLLTGHREAWFSNGKPNPCLGVSIGIHKVDGHCAWGLAIPPSHALQRGLSDLMMLVKMHQVRMLHDPKKILKKLQPAELELDSTCSLHAKIG